MGMAEGGGAGGGRGGRGGRKGKKAVATEDHTLQNKKVAVKKAQTKQGGGGGCGGSSNEGVSDNFYKL